MSTKEQKNQEHDLQIAINRSETEITKLDIMDDYFLEKLGMDTNELKLLQTWYPGITAPELMYAVGFQNETGLSIAKKEIWLVKRGSYQKINGQKEWVEKYEPMTGIEGSRKIARLNSKNMDIPYIPAKTGYELKEVPTVESVNGKLQYSKSDQLVGYAEIEYNDKLVRLEVPFSEACQWTKEKTDKFGNITEPARLTTFWSKNPLHMIQKVAEARLNKKVYGVAIEIEGDSLDNNIEPVEIISSDQDSSVIPTGKQITDIKKDYEQVGTTEDTWKDISTDSVEKELEELDSLINSNEEKEILGNKMSINDKFKVKCEDYGITDQVIIKYFNDIMLIKIDNIEDFYNDPDFETFKYNFVQQDLNLNSLLNIKKSI